MQETSKTFYKIFTKILITKSRGIVLHRSHPTIRQLKRPAHGFAASLELTTLRRLVAEIITWRPVDLERSKSYQGAVSIAFRVTV